MRLVFLGTPDFAVPSLQAIVAAGHEVALIITRPDQPRGRGRQVAACAVKRAAQELGLEVAQPASVNQVEFIARLRALRLDLGIVVAFGKLLSADFLTAPAHGYLNVHASLLPRWRGAAPIQRGLLAGDTEFGVTVQCVAEQMDAGDIVAAQRITALADDTLGSLEAKLAPLGARLLVESLAQVERGTVLRQPQDGSGVTFAPSIKRGEEQIAWRRPAREIANQVRAFNPRPVAVTAFRGRSLRVFAATSVNDLCGEPGTIAALSRSGPMVAAGEGGLIMREVQLAGRSRMPGLAWANGMRLGLGERLGAQVTND